MAIRGKEEKTSNYFQLLVLRASDSLELKKWMDRKEKYKWLSPAIANEILEDLAHATLRIICGFVRGSKYYSVMVDETPDASQKEQISICIRRVNDKFEIEELFLGFYATEDTKSATLLKCLLDALCRLNFPIHYCRGQCFDGAANMSGQISGLQTLMRQQEQRALYVHCRGHNLNLVAQDSIEEHIEMRNIMNLVQNFISFTRGSPKRLNCFNSFKLEEGDGTSLRPFCPTRWILRKPSITSITSNYAAVIHFLEDFENHSDNTSKQKAEAAGHLESFQKFDTFFKLEMLRIIFTLVEDSNTALQGETSIYNRTVYMFHMIKFTL